MGHVYIEIRCLFTSKLSAWFTLTVLAPKKNVLYKEHFFCSRAIANHFWVILCYFTPFSFFEFHEVRSFSLQYLHNRILVYSHTLVVWNSHVLIAQTWTVMSFGNVGFESKLCDLFTNCWRTVQVHAVQICLCSLFGMGVIVLMRCITYTWRCARARTHTHTCMRMQIWRNTCG